MAYDLIFDARDAGFPHWPAVLGAALSCLFGCVIFTLRASRVVRCMGLLLPLVAGPGMLAASWLDHAELTEALDAGRASFVEGHVEHFEPKRDRRPAMFSVRGERFCVSFRPRGTSWFEATGDVVSVGTRVRVWHVHSRIARMERQTRGRANR